MVKTRARVPSALALAEANEVTRSSGTLIPEGADILDVLVAGVEEVGVGERRQTEHRVGRDERKQDEWMSTKSTGG